MSKESSVKKDKCDLGPSSQYYLPEVEQWADKIANEARRVITGQITISIYAYRYSRVEYLAADFSGATGCLSLTFCAGFPHDYGDADVSVPDMPEAIAMIGVVAKNLNALVTL
ncbi:hypothetical protein [Pseudomonas sp. PSPC3-3]|uniref:hypothetical protein n=1 Tax=unclassified Pseudomonas TaxID=196821 RepID=UPI003CF5C930